MKEIQPEIECILTAYTGGDIVPAVVEENQRRFGTAKTNFRVLDLTCDPLPQVDLVLIRDCFLHLPNRLILAALQNVSNSQSRYLLASTYTTHLKNLDSGGIDLAGRRINLCTWPFSLPKPIEVIAEGCTEGNGAFADKSLALWRLADLDIPTMAKRVRLADWINYWKRGASGALQRLERIRHRIGALTRR